MFVSQFMMHTATTPTSGYAALFSYVVPKQLYWLILQSFHKWFAFCKASWGKETILSNYNFGLWKVAQIHLPKKVSTFSQLQRIMSLKFNSSLCHKVIFLCICKRTCLGSPNQKYFFYNLCTIFCAICIHDVHCLLIYSLLIKGLA